jgi:transcriptional regulator with XRE-family HTH domain
VEFGEWLRIQLRQRGETMTAFGNLVGVTDATVSRWISGQRRPDVASTQKIARVLHLPTDLVMEMAGHDLADGSDLDALQRQLTRLIAEKDALEQQGRHAEQRLAEVTRRIDQIRRQEAELRWLEESEHGPMQMRSQRSIPSEETYGSPAGESASPRDMTDARKSVPDQSRRWSSLHLLEALLPEPAQLGMAFLSEFRDQWSARERDAFALGLHLGLQVAEAQARLEHSREARENDGENSLEDERNQSR